MGPKRNPPRPTQKLGGESLERMARVSTGLEPFAKPPAASSQVLPVEEFSLPDEHLIDATFVELPPNITRPRTLARTVKRADLDLGKGGNVDEDDWGEIEIEGNADAVGSGGVDASEPVSDPDDRKGPAQSRAITNNDPITMALLAEVARSSKTEDFDPTHLDEAHRAAHEAPVGTQDKTPHAHPHIKRRDK